MKEKLQNYMEKPANKPNEIVIDLPDYLKDFDKRKKAVENINDKKFQEIEQRIMSGETDFSEDEIIDYLDYLDKIESEGYKLDSWLMSEQIKLFPKNISVDTFKIKNNKLIIKPRTSFEPEIIEGDADFDTEEGKEFWDINYQQKKRCFEMLEKNGAHQAVDYITKLISDHGGYELTNIHEKSILEILKKDIAYSEKVIFENLKNQFYDNFPAKMLIWLACDIFGIDHVKEKIDTFATPDQQKNIYIFHSLLELANENKIKIDFETIDSLDIQIKPANQELSEDEEENEKIKQDIINIAEKNYRKMFTDQNGKVNETAVHIIIDELKNNLNNIKDQRAYLLKYKDEVIAFCRFEPVSDTEVYAGSLNVYDELRDFQIGKFFSDTVLAEEAKYNVILMQSRENNIANSLYEKQGFIKTGESEEILGEDLIVKLYNYRMDKREKNTQEDKIAA